MTFAKSNNEPIRETVAASLESDGPSGSFLAAVVQLNSTSDLDANWCQARDLIVEAARRGASLVATPENTNFLGPHDRKVALAEPLDGPTVARFADLARSLRIYLLLGSYNERAATPDRCHNTSVLFDPTGAIRAVYRKLHLFDVDLGARGVRFQESATVEPGTEPIVAKTALGSLGMSICYDLRFAEFYQVLTERGARILAVPSAFTATTGQAHWEVLIRARAIENQAYVIAPAQTGRHDDEGLRASHGESMIVDPWGVVLARVGEGPGLALAEIDLQRVERIRREMPVAHHRRCRVMFGFDSR
ncbi:Nitrilase/cyanide hydratase and apolipoprotein N-acyltransferase [Isosphaera pallida ATCC 43644]|jgi:predicted amidohydrolase|uniref:Nitrilase/cyanide hydratase and apolipoprotein N-acyltransferase n=1 Tax=Isosphaera pallida (strain ATCC 43644 / DSM 9630 / IS1B) TaxID=575540 RepID=E8QXD0_ISOPI|nr:carbon-nitrogen hydrolase family protein [Isosphaera pallida]ADV61971.1 Nitrilase/cyanide hydratase and apolipoprotein N-acyltransferase [Isosphaera pallida ATCC 43644]